MPTLRVLADGRTVYATPGQPDRDGVPVFVARGLDRVLLTFDYTAWLGAATVSATLWDGHGATLTGATTSGALVSVLADVPSYGAATITNTLQASDGRVIHITARVAPSVNPPDWGAVCGYGGSGAATLDIASLPTTLPATSGVLWNNGGVLSIS